MKINIVAKKMSEDMKNPPRLIKTGLKEVDQNRFSWRKGELVVISGRPSMGKSSFMLTQVVNISIMSGIPVGVFSLETDEITLTKKLISNHCKIDSHAISNWNMQESEWETLNSCINEIKNAEIYLDCPPRLSIQDLYVKAKKMVIEHRVRAIFIDYIQLMSVTDSYSDNRYNEMNYISRELKNMARELDITVFAISQMNRNSENNNLRLGTEGKKPRLSDLRDSGTLCDDADVVLFIYRPEYYRITEDEMGNSLVGVAEIMVKKNRNGETFTAQTGYKSEFHLFSDQFIQNKPIIINSKETDESVPF